MIKLYPVATGDGIRLFARDFLPTSFTLTGATPLGSGTVILRYSRS